MHDLASSNPAGGKQRLLNARTSAERVYLGLYQEIKSQQLRPGDALQEEEVARQYQVSRTPVREALRRLMQGGLVERVGGGIVVRWLSPNEVADIYPIIAVLEGLGARLAAARAMPADLAHLISLHNTMKGLATSGNDTAFVDCNLEFHATIARIASNAHLTNEIDRFRTITAHFRHVLLSLPGRQIQSISEHQLLLKAMRKGDAGQAEASMRAHVEAACRLLLTTLSAAELIMRSVPPTERVRRLSTRTVDPSDGEIGALAPTTSIPVEEPDDLL